MIHRCMSVEGPPPSNISFLFAFSSHPLCCATSVKCCSRTTLIYLEWVKSITRISDITPILPACASRQSKVVRYVSEYGQRTIRGSERILRNTTSIWSIVKGAITCPEDRTISGTNMQVLLEETNFVPWISILVGHWSRSLQHKN